MNAKSVWYWTPCQAAYLMVILGCAGPQGSTTRVHRIEASGPIPWLTPSGEKPRVAVVVNDGQSGQTVSWPEHSRESTLEKFSRAVGDTRLFELIPRDDVTEALERECSHTGTKEDRVRCLHRNLNADVVLEANYAGGWRIGIGVVKLPPSLVDSEWILQFKFLVYDAKSGKPVIRVEEEYHVHEESLKYAGDSCDVIFQRALNKSVSYALSQLSLFLDSADPPSAVALNAVQR